MARNPYAEGLPLTFLDHRLIHGDALSGPFFASLSILPVTGRPLDPLLARGVADRLAAALGRARRLVAELDASIGRDLPDLLLKEMAKERLDNVLHPLRHLGPVLGWGCGDAGEGRRRRLVAPRWRGC